METGDQKTPLNVFLVCVCVCVFFWPCGILLSRKPTANGNKGITQFNVRISYGVVNIPKIVNVPDTNEMLSATGNKSANTNLLK